MSSLSTGFDFGNNLFMQKLAQLAPQLLTDPMALAQAAAQKGPPPAIAQNTAATAGAPAGDPNAKLLAAFGEALKTPAVPKLQTYQPGQPPASHDAYQAPDLTQLLSSALNAQFKGVSPPSTLGQLLGK